MEVIDSDEVLDVLLGRRGSYRVRLLSTVLIDMPDLRGFERTLMTELWGDASSILDRPRECVNGEDGMRGLNGLEKEADRLGEGEGDGEGEGRAVGEGKAGSTSWIVLSACFSVARLLVE